MAQITDQDRERVRSLHADGKGRNDIVRETGLSAGTVTNIARDLGLTFDRAAVATATHARKADLAARRTALIERYYEQAEAILDRLDRTEHTLKEVSLGKVVTYQAADLPPQDVKALIQASGAAVSQAVKLEQVDATDGADTARSLIGQLAEGLTAAYRAMNEGDGDAQ